MALETQDPVRTVLRSAQLFLIDTGVPCGRGVMEHSQNGYLASIERNWEHEKEFWVYTIRRSQSGELLYRGFSKSAVEAAKTVEERIQALGLRKYA